MTAQPAGDAFANVVKINTPGLYPAIDMATYHSDCCEGPSVSGSGLVKIEQTCPALFWHTWPGNPERAQEEPTDAMLFGTVTHALVLEGEAAARKLIGILPADHNGRTKEGKAQKREIFEAGKTPLAWEDWQAALSMAKALREHPMAAKAFSDGKPEQTLVWKDPGTGLWLKARPDWLPRASQFVPNYKTALSVKPSEWARQATNLGYHQGAALCADGLKVVCGMDRPHVYFVAQEKQAPWLVQILTLSDVALDWGANLNRKAIDTIARCIDAGHWPGYSDGAVQVDMPGWKERELMARHTAGEFSWAMRAQAPLEA